MSATGISEPSIWQSDWPNWIRAMSLIGGSSYQPDVLEATVTSTGAPQRGQLVAPASSGARHHRQAAATGGVVVIGYSVTWWTYIDWMPMRPGPVKRAMLILRPPNTPEVSWRRSTSMLTEESL